MLERLHKYLAHCGVASRRKAELMIAEGRVYVNGKLVTEMGVKVDPEKDRVTVDRKPVVHEPLVYYLLNKPAGYASTVQDERERRTVMDLLKGIPERVYPVGRLDIDSEGLIVFTNDGNMAYYLTHPSRGVLKTYRATIAGDINPAIVQQLVEKGIRLGAMKIQPVKASVIRRGKTISTVEVTVGEGVNREIRRIFAALGHEVKRLVRTRIGSLAIRGLAKGKYRPLRKAELSKLHASMERAISEAGQEAINARQRTRYYGSRESSRMGKPDPARKRGGKRTTIDLGLVAPEPLPSAESTTTKRTSRSSTKGRPAKRRATGKTQSSPQNRNGKEVGKTSPTRGSAAKSKGANKGKGKATTAKPTRTAKGKKSNARSSQKSRKAPAAPTTAHPLSKKKKRPKKKSK